MEHSISQIQDQLIKEGILDSYTEEHPKKKHMPKKTQEQIEFEEFFDLARNRRKGSGRVYHKTACKQNGQ